MIDLKQEKERKLSTQDVYDIISFAVQAAEDNGFINDFILERALYEFAVLILFPEYKDTYTHLVAENINLAWDQMLEDGVLDQLVSEHSQDLNYITNCGVKWAEEFSKYSYSVRGLLNSVQEITGRITDLNAQRLTEIAKNAGVTDILKIADEWGMNREDSKDNTNSLEVIDGESLFS